jgi:hypothetical protein
MPNENPAATCSNCRRPTNNHRPWCGTYKTEHEVPKAGDIVNHPVLGPTELISVYSRQDAVDDGVLVDCTEGFFDDLNRSAGVIFDVAMTRTIFERYVEVPKSLEGVQDQKGRYWDILLLFWTAARTNLDCQECLFEITSIPNGGECWTNERAATLPQQRIAELKAVAGPGDRGEPCLTFMLRWED